MKKKGQDCCVSGIIIREGLECSKLHLMAVMEKLIVFFVCFFCCVGYLVTVKAEEGLLPK